MWIVMEMDTAMPVSVNAQLIMSMHKIALIMDVSTFMFLLLSNEMILHMIPLTEKVDVLRV